MVPASGAKAPTRIFIRVLLPEPFSPTRPTTSPRVQGKVNAAQDRALAAQRPWTVVLGLVLLPWLGVRPAQAQVPSVLPVLAPKDGQTVTANPAVVIYAQRMLLGADQTTYTIALDQRPSDPANGPSQPAQIRGG